MRSAPSQRRARAVADHEADERRRAAHGDELDRTGRPDASGFLNAKDTRVTTGITRSATCALEEIAISVASFILPRRAITTAPPCSAALPTIATITIAMKNSERCAASAKASERVDEDLADQRSHHRGHPEDDERRTQAPAWWHS